MPRVSEVWWTKTQPGCWTASNGLLKINLYSQKEVLWEIWRAGEVVALGMASDEEEGKHLAEQMVKMFPVQDKAETPQQRIKRGSLPPGIRGRK